MSAEAGGEPPIRNRERRSFQKMLSALPVTAHLELYAQFEHTAKWREVKEGQVELDDANTPPAVFREMMIFCAARVTRKRPLPQPGPPPSVEEDIGGTAGTAARAEPAAPARPDPTDYSWVSSDSGETSSSESSASSSAAEAEAEPDGVDSLVDPVTT
eukprot:Protomagalhaensia_sp_Gyna_25__2250@NODE_2229_length_1206_cov_4_054841_g1848_i0_p1_GENE_NODE_2229_length_1206_cov_4_054841_g1848_i0NODE_2229_length_1206_cov_4_054841_g1848_i0_p1_ORF_typecomplete_len158_score37_19UL42/PF17638_2/26UL42/PF17638_2/15_NODE_2229_length_1206_cov_4_054841_g1848_i020493